MPVGAIIPPVVQIKTPVEYKKTPVHISCQLIVTHAFFQLRSHSLGKLEPWSEKRYLSQGLPDDYVINISIILILFSGALMFVLSFHRHLQLAEGVYESLCFY